MISSAAGYSPQIDGGLHSVASASVLALVKSLAQTVAKDNVRVNGVSTGMVRSIQNCLLYIFIFRLKETVLDLFGTTYRKMSTKHNCGKIYKR